MSKQLWEADPKDLVVGIFWYTICLLLVGVGLGVLLYKLFTWLF